MAAPRKVKAVVENIHYYKDGITRFILNPEIKCRFKPGQFLHLALDPYDPSYNWPESRVFSIASSNKKHELEILISPKGDFTNSMVTSLKVDDVVWIKLPYGDFNLNKSNDNSIVLVAGGTGISPFIGFLEDLQYETTKKSKVHLYYGVRSQDHIIYDKLLTNLKENLNHFKLDLFIEKNSSPIDYPHQSGIIDIDQILNDTIYIDNTVYYVSGSPSLISNFIDKANAKGIDNDKVKFDKWD